MRDKYVDEAFRLQQLHTIEFPDYKYKPKKRARNVNGVGNNIEADEYISTVENATPSIPKSLTSNNDDNCQTNYENIKFSINQKCFTRVNNSNSDGDYLCNHTPLTVQQHETPIDAIVCHRNYLHPCSQINNKLNTELHEPVKANYTNRNTTHIDHQYDKKVFISNDVNNDDIYKENKEIDETMTVLVSGDRNLEHGTYQLHKIISCQTVDGIAESLISPSLLGQGNQIKEIRILNMQSPTIQLLNKQPILCRAVLCEPVKAAVIRQPTAPIRTNSSILSGFVLNSTANNLDFQPFTTQTTDATISSISPNLSSPFELGYNKPNSNLQSGIKLENVKSPYPNEK
ncbi:transcription factor SOX-14 [Schistosoma japonicum]|uniref:Transcription factor SOX-14 n=1 Tax=Schistosoma japonicum TaxID=6182 RepID=A0A4Z2DC13_SCHJA|nr:transcription factor SOX-14 [Schistosoma japonicum]